MATSTCARKPILKRSTTTPVSSPSTSAAPHSATRGAVHFPPSPTLTRTFTAHSATIYDRSPIVVPPNVCALPRRGCPGRTYVIGTGQTGSPSPSPRTAVMDGRHLHPRAYAAHDGDESDGEYYGDAASRTPMPSPYFGQGVPPPLVRETNSSSESSDSDTFGPHFPSISGTSPTRGRGRGRSRSRSRSPSDTRKPMQRDQVKINVPKDRTHARHHRPESVIEDEAELEIKYKALDSQCSFSFTGTRFDMQSDEGCFAGF